MLMEGSVGVVMRQGACRSMPRPHPIHPPHLPTPPTNQTTTGKTEDLRSQLEAAQEELAPKKEAAVGLQARTINMCIGV